MSDVVQVVHLDVVLEDKHGCHGGRRDWDCGGCAGTEKRIKFDLLINLILGISQEFRTAVNLRSLTD